MKQGTTIGKVSKRIKEIENILLSIRQETPKELCQRLSVIWKVSHRQFYRYYRTARTKIEKEYSERLSLAVQVHYSERTNLYEKAVKKGDIKTSLSILQDMAKIQGVYSPERTENLQKIDFANMPPEILELAIIKMLKE